MQLLFKDDIHKGERFGLDRLFRLLETLLKRVALADRLERNRIDDKLALSGIHNKAKARAMHFEKCFLHLLEGSGFYGQRGIGPLVPDAKSPKNRLDFIALGEQLGSSLSLEIRQEQFSLFDSGPIKELFDGTLF